MIALLIAGAIIAAHIPTVPATQPATFRVVNRSTVAVMNCSGYACQPSGFFLEGTEGEVWSISPDGEGYKLGLRANGLMGSASCTLTESAPDYEIIS